MSLLSPDLAGFILGILDDDKAVGGRLGERLLGGGALIGTNTVRGELLGRHSSNAQAGRAGRLVALAVQHDLFSMATDARKEEVV